MSSQRSGPERSRRKRASILQGVYEENVRTRRGEPSPSSPRPAQQQHREEDEDASQRRWGVVFMALALFVVAGGIAYAAGGIELFAGGAPGAPEAAPADSAGRSARGRAVPFQASADAPEVPVQALPAGGGESESIVGLFGLGVKTVVLDPGHGGKKDGALGPGGTKEKHVALDVARRLRRRLEAHYNYRVLMTRTGDEHRSLRERVQFANEHQADLFISIHVNSLPVQDVNSVETYYYGQDADPEVKRLARAENQASGYSVAEFNTLLRETGRRMRREESERLAGSIQSSLFRNIQRRDPDLRDWGVRTAPFVVLLGVEAPSVLAEIGVISNPAEEARLRRPAYRAKLARFLEEGIAEYLGTPLPPDAAAAAAPTDTVAAASR